MHVLAACLAAFAVQQGAEAQWNSGDISGTYQWLDGANWVGGIVTNTITTTSTATGNLVFQWSTGTTISNTITPGFSAPAQRTVVFQATSGTQTLNFNNGSGFAINGQFNNNGYIDSNLILNLVSGTVTMLSSNQRSFDIRSKLTGPGSLSTGEAGFLVLSNTANDFTGNLIVNSGGNSQDGLRLSANTYGTPANLITNQTTGHFAKLSLNSSGTYRFNNPTTTAGTAQISPSGNFNTVFAPVSVVSTTFTATIGNTNGSMGLSKFGSGTLTLLGPGNSYSGATTLEEGVLNIRSIGNASAVSSLGNSGTAATNLVFTGGQLQYSGSAAGSTNRLFSIGTGGGGIIADGTTGQLLFTGGGTIGFNGQSGARVFTLSGTNTGTNTLTTALADNGGQTALVKSGLGRWVLGGSHAYSGTTRIDAGTLSIGAGASIGSSRTVVVGTAAGSGARLDVTDTEYTFTGGQTLMGSGTVAGGGVAPTTVTINGRLSPGNSPGLLTFDNTSLALGSTGNVIMEISGSTRGTQYDAIDITGGANGGGLTYGGTMTLNFTQTFTSGTFNLFKFDLNETSGAFSSVVFDPASQYTGSWGLMGDVWKVTTNDNTVMEFRKNVVDGGVSYGQLVIVPEPLTLGLLGIGSGIAVVGLRHLRRRKANGVNGTSSSDNTADAV